MMLHEPVGPLNLSRITVSTDGEVSVKLSISVGWRRIADAIAELDEAHESLRQEMLGELDWVALANPHHTGDGMSAEPTCHCTTKVHEFGSPECERAARPIPKWLLEKDTWTPNEETK